MTPGAAVGFSPGATQLCRARGDGIPLLSPLPVPEVVTLENENKVLAAPQHSGDSVVGTAAMYGPLLWAACGSDPRLLSCLAEANGAYRAFSDFTA